MYHITIDDFKNSNNKTFFLFVIVDIYDKIMFKMISNNQNPVWQPALINMAPLP